MATHIVIQIPMGGYSRTNIPATVIAIIDETDIYLSPTLGLIAGGGLPVTTRAHDLNVDAILVARK